MNPISQSQSLKSPESRGLWPIIYGIYCRPLRTGDQEDSLVPKLLKSIRGQKISHVTAGDEHTVALTEDGGIFAWGDGKCGQNGHGRPIVQNTPRKTSQFLLESLSKSVLTDTQPANG